MKPDRYVSADGDDSNDGLSPETAWRTLRKVQEFEAAHQNEKRDGPYYVGLRAGDEFPLKLGAT